MVKSFAILNQMWTQKIIFISPKTWDKLNDSQRDIVKDAAESAIELTDAWQYVREQEFIKKAEKATDNTDQAAKHYVTQD